MFNKSLKEHANFKSKKGFSGVNLCKTLCIIAPGDQMAAISTEKYKRKLNALQKSVDLLYYTNDKSESENGYSKLNVKWNGVPEHEIIDSILSRQYDLLIFLYPEMEPHMKYLAILCNAKFKIGPRFDDCTHIFDLMIDGNSYSDTEKLIKSIDQHLKLIST
ncbi:MAG: hypothetical protein AAGA77_06905 [Bacteroidota bacterium]